MGIVPGGGTALARLAASVKAPKVSDRESDVATGYAIVKQALGAPLRQIAENAGKLGAVIERRVLDESKFQTGFDADAGVMCDLIEKGIVDPAKVTRSALVNAVSVATTFFRPIASSRSPEGQGRRQRGSRPRRRSRRLLTKKETTPWQPKPSRR
jgi:chaperonin GroEL